MMDLSIKEAEALCYKAARGFGYSWGLAEEAGFAAAWLAKAGLSDLSDLAKLLQEAQSENLKYVDALEPKCNWSSGGDGKLCPISTGAYLSDNQSCLRDGKTITINWVANPILLLPFVANISLGAQDSIEIAWGGVKAQIKQQWISLSDQGNSLNAEVADKVTLNIRADHQFEPWQFMDRCRVTEPTLSILLEYAHKTYVPETEELMRVGAGGENVNDD